MGPYFLEATSMCGLDQDKSATLCSNSAKRAPDRSDQSPGPRLTDMQFLVQGLGFGV